MSETLIREAEARDCDAGAETFLQTGFWGVFKSEFGWKPHHFRVEPGNPLLVLEKRFLRTISFGTFPAALRCLPRSAAPRKFFKGLAAALKPRLSPACVFLRFDPPGRNRKPNPQGRSSRSGAALSAAEMDVQPPDTALLAIAGRSDEDLLAGMKPKWRYNIRLAEKKGVVVTMERGPTTWMLFTASMKPRPRGTG
jgi:lipid II:glycine glycyltransferase (peptidoglycan interpeptide bridge formation enzyme)